MNRKPLYFSTSFYIYTTFVIMRKRGLVETDRPHLGGRTQTKKDKPTNHPEHKKHGLETWGLVLARSVGNGNGMGMETGDGMGDHGIGTDGRAAGIWLASVLGILYSGLGVGTWNPAPSFFYCCWLFIYPPTPFSTSSLNSKSFLFARLAKKRGL